MNTIRMRKVLSGLLIGISSLVLLASLVGMVLAWVYNEPLTLEAVSRLEEADTQLSQIPEVRGILEKLRGALDGLNSLPFVQFDIPGDDLLANIITEVDSLDGEIVNMQELAQRASTFINDTSYLLGGDFQETKQNLEALLIVLDGYDAKLTDWLAQVQMLQTSVPGWIDNASLSLTVALFWSAFSQLGLLLHGLRLWHGENPLAVLAKLRKPTSDIPPETE